MQRIADEEIEMRVRDALATDPHLASVDIRVRVVGGIVTLEGEVANPERRHRAEEVARQVPGVVAVRNRLHVMALRERAYEVERIPPPEEGG